jgi:hypothetical protein
VRKYPGGYNASAFRRSAETGRLPAIPIVCGPGLSQPLSILVNSSLAKSRLASRKNGTSGMNTPGRARLGGGPDRHASVCRAPAGGRGLGAGPGH